MEKRVNTLPFRHLYPYTSRFMDISGKNYHYIDEGSGDPIIMVHGNPTWSFYFRALIRDLSPRYRTIVPDHIGCGLSEKPRIGYDYRLKTRIDDLSEFLERLDLPDRVTMVVHDWGGAIGMGWAVENAHMVKRIIVLNTAAFLAPSGKKIPIRLRLIRDFSGFAVPAVLGLNLFARGALFLAAKKRLSREVKAGLIAPYNSWNNRIATLKFVQDIPVKPGDPSWDRMVRLEKRLDRLKGVPMCILWGMKDFVFDGDYLSEWMHRFPEAEVHRFHRAGHYILEDEPANVSGRVQKFLREHRI